MEMPCDEFPGLRGVGFGGKRRWGRAETVGAMVECPNSRLDRRFRRSVQPGPSRRKCGGNIVRVSASHVRQLLLGRLERRMENNDDSTEYCCSSLVAHADGQLCLSPGSRPIRIRAHGNDPNARRKSGRLGAETGRALLPAEPNHRDPSGKHNDAVGLGIARAEVAAGSADRWTENVFGKRIRGQAGGIPSPRAGPRIPA